MRFKKVVSILVLFTMFIGIMPLAALAGKADVVSLGADLTSKQQGEILKEFGVTENEVELVKVSIQDVTTHLQGIATKQQIGTKAISSAYVKLLSKGEGLKIATHNVTWVTEEMYASALVTAGVEDAEVKVAAPFNVTGTTALTGIMKAFEAATGKKLNKEAQSVANEELFITGDMGKEIGKDEAVKLIGNVKKEIASRNIKTPEDIRQVIVDISKELKITLSDEQINQIMSLMEKISKLDLNVDTISKQLEKISGNLDIIKNTIEENKGLLQRILDALTGWLRSIFG